MWITHALIVLLLPLLSSCSHFRGGIIMMEPYGDTNVSSAGTVGYNFNFRMSWRTTYFRQASECQVNGKCNYIFGDGNLQCRSGCSGSLGPLSVNCTDCSRSGIWSTGSGHFLSNLPVNQSIEASFTGGDWIGGVGGNWELRTRLNTTLRNGVLNTSPIAATPPIVVIQSNCNQTIKIPVQDKDGDVVRCRWAESTKGECASVCRKYKEKLSETECTLTWTAKASGNHYIPVALQVEDFESIESTTPLSSIPVQFLIQVVNSKEPCSSGPVFIPPTRREGSCIGVAYRTTLNETILVDVGTSDNKVTEIQTQSPGDLNRKLWQSSPSVWAMTYTWSATPGDAAPKIFCFKAIDQHSRSTEQRCVTLIPGIPPPKILDFSPREAIDKTNSVWILEFNTAIFRPNRTAYVNFHQLQDNKRILQIDASNPRVATFEFRKLTLTGSFPFIEKEEYYVTLEDGIVKGKEFCGPESFTITNKTFWTFRIKDTTPPVLSCVSCPTGSRSSIHFAWTINEPATVSCRLFNPQLVYSLISCSISGLSSGQLSKGRYTLFVDIKDTAGNIAAINRNFYIDTTPPTARIEYAPPAETNATTASVGFSCTDDYSRSCTFECSLNQNPPTGPTNNPSRCQTPYSSSLIESGRLYNFSVRAIDQLGNIGQIKSILFRVDRELPVLTMPNNVTINCGADISPVVVGRASSVDNVGVKAVTFTDTYDRSAVNGSTDHCKTLRWWKAVDLAGNEATAAQVISFTGVKTMTVRGQKSIDIPCVDAAAVIKDLENWQNYLTIKQNCQRNITVTYSDNPVLKQCNSGTERTWDVKDDCGHSVLYKQTLRILPADLPLYPTNGDLNVELRPQFVWRAYPFTNSYMLYVWQMNAKDKEDYKLRVYRTSSNVPRRLQPNTKYLWRLEYQQNNQVIPSPTWGFQTQPVTDLAVQNVVAPSTAFTGEDITIEWTTMNVGGASSTTFQWYDGLYVGKSSDFRTARFVQQVAQRRILFSGDGYKASTILNIPHSDFGTYYVFIIADRYKSMTGEIEWSNNVIMRPSPIEIRLAPPPDLEVEHVILIPDSVYSGEEITVKYRVVNSGNGILRGKTWMDMIVIETDSVKVLHSSAQNVQLLPGSTYDRIVKVQVPHRIFGDFNITISTDANNNVFEHLSESNNLKSASLKVRLTPPPDFAVERVNVPKMTSTGEVLVVNYTVRNSGIGQNYEPYWYDRVQMVTGLATITIGTVFNSGILGSGQSYTKAIQYKIPASLTTGTYSVSVVTNIGERIFEYQSSANNQKNANIEIVQKLPDFVPTIQSLKSNATSKGNILTVSFEVTNKGFRLPQSNRLTVQIFARSGRSRQNLNTYLISIPMSGNATELRQVSLSPTLYGDLDIGIRLNDGRWISEKDYTNNEASSVISIPDIRPILEVQSLENGELLSARNASLEWTVRNGGISEIAKSIWTDAAYFLREGQGQSQWINLGRVKGTRSLNPDEAYSVKTNVVIPEPVSGWGFIIIVPNDDNEIFVKSVKERYRKSVMVGMPATADLVPILITTQQETFEGTRVLTVNWEVENKGNSFAREINWNDVVTVNKGNRKIQRSRAISANLGALATYQQTIKIVLPAGMSGRILVSVLVDATDSIAEYNTEDNNEDFISVTVPDIPKPLIAVEEIVAKIPPLAGEKFNLTYKVKNKGTNLPSSSWQDGVYYYTASGVIGLPTTQDIIENGVLLATVDQSRELESGATYTQRVELALPQDVSGEGNIYVISRLGDVRKGEEDVQVTPGRQKVNVEPMPLPDLQVDMLRDAFSIETEQPFYHDFTVMNTGEGRTLRPWWDKIYLSTDVLSDPFDKVLISIPSKRLLGRNESYTQSVEIRIPSTVVGGQYNLLVETGISLDEQTKVGNKASKPLLIKQLPPSDLHVVSVSADKTDLIAGQEFHLEWTLANAGVEKAHGYKCDNQYLSKDKEWDMEDEEIRTPVCGRFEFEPYQTKNKTYNYKSKNIVPFTKFGRYHGLVTVRSNVYDVNLQNNNATTVSLNVSMPVLKLGVTEEMTLTGAQERIFRITGVPEEEVLIVDLKAPKTGPFHNLYLKKNGVPTSGEYDLRSNQPFSVSQTIVAPNTSPGDFYVLLTNTAEEIPYKIQLLAKLAVFEIHNVKPLRAALADSVTFIVNGALFSTEMTASLVGKDGEISITRITVSSISQAYITFTLRSYSPGNYQIRLKDQNTDKIIKSDQIITLTGSLSPGNLAVQLNSGRALRVGETGAVELNIKNTGNSDVPTPVFLLATQSGGTFVPMIPEGSDARGEWLFLAPTTDDYCRSLPPGTMKTYSFSLPSPDEPRRTELKLLLVSDQSYQTVEDNLKSNLRNTRQDLDDTQWNVLWVRFRSLYGDGFESWKGHILDVVSEQTKYNRKEHDINKVLEFLLNIADGLTTDKLMEQVTDIWEPTVPDILLTRRFSLRQSIGSKSGYFGLGWTIPMLDFELLEINQNVIVLLIQRFPVYLTNLDENLYAGQGYTAIVNGTEITVTSALENVKNVLNITTKKLVAKLFRNRRLTYLYSNTKIEITDSDMNHLSLYLAPYSGDTLCQKAELKSKEGNMLHSVDYDYLPSSSRLSSVTGGGNAVTYAYYPDGRLRETKFGNNFRDVFAYDQDRMLSSLDKHNPNGDSVQKILFKATKYGTLISTIANVSSETVFDMTGRQIAFTPSEGALPFVLETSPDGTAYKLRLGDEVLQSGSQQGNKVVGLNANRGSSSMVAVSEGVFEVHDQGNNVFKMEFDKNERLRKYVFPDGVYERYVYDDNGRMSASVARDGGVTYLDHDDRGRLINVTMPDGFLFTGYLDADKGNAIRQLSNQDGVVNIEYDENNRPIRVKHSDGHVVDYGWNSLGQLVALRTTGYSVSYHYNSHAKLVRVKDELKGAMLGQFEYDVSGQLKKKVLGNGDYTTFTYDPRSRVIKSLTNYHKDGTIASYFNMTYNKKGQKTRMDTKEGVYKYTYDAGGQVVGWTEPKGGATNIEYDKVLNRLVVVKEKLKVVYKHNNVHQMTSVDTLKLQYDKNGNLVYKENADGSRLKLRFNSINQLVWMDNDTLSCNFAYDPLGALMKHNCSDGTSTRYITDYQAPYGYNLLVRKTGGKQENFYHALSLGLLSAKDELSSYFYHFDPDLSTVAITDTNSKLLNSYKHSPFGEEMETVEQWLKNPFRHRGQLGVFNLPGSRDKYMVRARVYDPNMGRFISMDPFHHGRQGTTNSYAYCNNNPNECKDPNGEWLQFVAAAALIGGLANTIATTGYSVYQGMSNGQSFTESLPSLGNVAGSFVSGAITGAAIAGGALPGALAGTTFVGGFVGGAAGTAISNAIDGQPQSADSIIYNGLLNGLGAKYLPPTFIGPYQQHLNNLVKHSYLHWITRNSFKESMKRFWKPFAITYGLGSGLGIFAGNVLNKLWAAFREWVRSRDPNDIIGPPGVGELNFIPGDLIGRYKIRFENVANASAPAQKVVIKAGISESVELRSFRLGPIGFGETDLELDYSKAMERRAVDLSDSKSYAVRVQAGIDVIERTAWWELTTVNASTGELIPDPLIGFLPPNNNASDGEGYVTYEIGMMPSLPHMTKIKAKAAIVFDQNEIIETPEIFNTIDATNPTSSLVLQQNLSTPVLQVKSSDTGASVKNVNIYRLTSDGKLDPFLQDLESDAAVLLQDLPVKARSMRLVSMAQDKVGNYEVKDVNPANIITVSVEPSVAVCPANCSNNGNCSSSGICNCNPGFIGLNCSVNGSTAEPPVLIFQVFNSTNGTVNGLVDYRLVSNASHTLQEIRLQNISQGMKWSSKGEASDSVVVLKPRDIGNFTLTIYCDIRVGWHEISARFMFNPFVSRQYVVAKFYVSHDGCQAKPTKLPTIVVPTSACRPRAELVIMVSLLAAMFLLKFTQ